MSIIRAFCSVATVASRYLQKFYIFKKINPKANKKLWSSYLMLTSLFININYICFVSNIGTKFVFMNALIEYVSKILDPLVKL